MASKESNYLDQFGRSLRFQVIQDADNLCTEFVVRSPKFPFIRWLLTTVTLNATGILLNLHQQDTHVMATCLFLLVVVLVVKLHRKVKEESLLVMASLGVQLTTTFASGRSQCVFYQSHQVADIVINEAVTMQRVMFYLCILLKDQAASSSRIGSLIPLYQQSWPGLACLRDIYRGIHKVMDFGPVIPDTS